MLPRHIRIACGVAVTLWILSVFNEVMLRGVRELFIIATLSIICGTSVALVLKRKPASLAHSSILKAFFLGFGMFSLSGGLGCVVRGAGFKLPFFDATAMTSSFSLGVATIAVTLTPDDT